MLTEIFSVCYTSTHGKANGYFLILAAQMMMHIKRGGITMKISARNQLKGKITSIQEGAVNGIVTIDIGGENIVTATISMNSIKELNLQVGKEAYAVIKATSVMVAVDH